jgi:xylulokinase
MAILGLDVGTTHCKAGLFSGDGAPLALASRPMAAMAQPAGLAGWDAEWLWQTIRAIVGDVTAGAAEAVEAVGVASMAESGLLVDRRSGCPRTPIIPWFDTGAAAEAERLLAAGDPLERFSRAGIYPSFKCSLAKLLWLRRHDARLLDGAVWLSAADYVAFRLAGVTATDFSLAGRTYAFRLDEKRWDGDWLDRFGLSPDLFPPAQPAGSPLGNGAQPALAVPGLAGGTPVVIAGHDHICAALAAGAISPGRLFDSMGTAEVLVGALAERPLGDKELASGLSYGCHVAPGHLYWLGGLSTSGGSVEWLRRILGDPPLSYEALEALLAEAGRRPGDILFFPYLAGSGSPHTDPATRAAFVGLAAGHGRSDLLKAVLEGAAYELEVIRRAAEGATGSPIDHFAAAGGGTRNRRWLQIKADVSNCRLEALATAEATLLGAAMLAGMGAGLYADAAAAVAAVARPPAGCYLPDGVNHRLYRRRFEEGYLELQEPLRRYFRQAGRAGPE